MPRSFVIFSIQARGEHDVGFYGYHLKKDGTLGAKPYHIFRKFKKIGHMELPEEA